MIRKLLELGKAESVTSRPGSMAQDRRWRQQTGMNTKPSHHRFPIALCAALCAVLSLAGVTASGQSAPGIPIPIEQVGSGNPAPFDYAKFEQDRKDATRAIEEQVQNETLDESIRNLWQQPLSQYHCPLNDGPLCSVTVTDAAKYMEALAKDPRVAKALRISEQGTDAERDLIFREVSQALEQMISGPPSRTPFGNGRTAPSINSQSGSMIYPLLMLRVDPRADSMRLLIRVSDFIQSVWQNEKPVITSEDLARHKDLFPGGFVPPFLPSYTHSGLGDMAAFAVRHMLDRYCDNADMLATLTPEQQRRLDVYRAYRERVRTKMETKRAEALGLSGPEQLTPVKLMDQAEAHYWDLAAWEAKRPEGAAYAKAKLDSEELIFELARTLLSD